MLPAGGWSYAMSALMAMGAATCWSPIAAARLETAAAAMSVSLPNFKQLKTREPGPRFIQVPESSAAGRAAALIDKHSDTIEQLRQRLGFEKDATVIAWLLEQLEQSPDLGKTIGDLLGAA